MALMTTDVKKITWQSLLTTSLIGTFAIATVGLNNTPEGIASDTCKNVKITIKNDTGDEIKVTKFEYRDFDKNKWRTENIFGIDGHQKLEPNKSFVTTRDLGSIGNDDTKFKVTYQHRIGGTKYEKPITMTTSQFKCTDDLNKTISLTE